MSVRAPDSRTVESRRQLPAGWSHDTAPRKARRDARVASNSGRRTVLLLGNYRPTLTVARALHRAGYRVVAGLGGGEGGAEFSRFVAEVWDHPPLVEGGESVFLAALGELLRRRVDIGVVYPVGEEFVNCLAHHPRSLPSNVVLASPVPETVRLCADKAALLERAVALGIACERFKIVRCQHELLAAANELGFPLVVRSLTPRMRLRHKKALICANTDDLEQLQPHWSAGHSALLVQRRAAGQRHNVFFAARHGRILRFVETRIWRTDHPDGTGLAVDGETVRPTPRLIEDTSRLVNFLGYTGIGLAQFILDPDTGRSCLLELNPRIAGSHAITEQSGAELSRLAIDVASGAAIAPARFPYRPGLRYAWTYGDLRGLKSAIEKREITLFEACAWLLRAIGTLIVARRHMTWCWADPLPTIALYLKLMPGVGRIFGSRRPGPPCRERPRPAGASHG